MSDDDMRNKISEACPEVCVWRTDIMEWVWLGRTREMFDPLNDLNAMAEAEQTLSEPERNRTSCRAPVALPRH